MFRSRAISASIYLFFLFITSSLTCAGEIQTPTVQESVQIIQEANSADLKQAIQDASRIPIESLPDGCREYFESAGVQDDSTLGEAVEQLKSTGDITSVDKAIKEATSSPELQPATLTIQAYKNNLDSQPATSNKIISQIYSALNSGAWTCYNYSKSCLSSAAQVVTSAPYLLFPPFLLEKLPSLFAQNASTVATTAAQNASTVVTTAAQNASTVVTAAENVSEIMTTTDLVNATTAAMNVAGGVNLLAVGVSVGVIVGGALICVIACYIVKKKRQQRSTYQPTATSEPKKSTTGFMPVVKELQDITTQK